ncbi:hypothetical protein VC83_08190 [Pseudogymnoascus destructans]|uniref:Septin-type G domain-containing protein n=2 Tax=Pseudogymnoascus destructans TaxID=655981 RepID=L8FY67_PSED2|nr:uncharacterized protein VC83_08190 [Pseudogymnoascus destructans]ELR05960.1 hypothetical protein GMDG_01922 [Pseudogymnoascus destructans 20631-21]OAF55219.1 hypothetical protein VC83_08190 [Pseudogymnoascus destructans]
MRPIPGDDAFSSRSRTSSDDGDKATPLARPDQPPMTFFLADEKSMEASLDRSVSNSSNQRHLRDHLKRSNYGVESIETIASQDSYDQDTTDEGRNTRSRGKKFNMSRTSSEGLAGSYSPSSVSSPDVTRNTSPSEPRRTLPNTAPLSATPSFLESPMLGSTFPHTRQPSEIDFLTDDGGSQAIVSSGDEDTQSPDVMEGSSSSQLVMPSLQMPSRRPFTDKGKDMGRLKILIAGDSGVGKTSLIKSIVQSCSDIVYVDPLESIPLTASEAVRNSRRKSKDTLRTHSTTKITEVFASTRAYPSWWSESEDSKILRRRRSMGDTVLERNLCFVDTPGYSGGISSMECITPVMDYIQSQYERTVSADLSDGELISMLSGGGGSQIDAVFYVINRNIKPVDIEYLRRLSQFTNIIPLLAQADALSTEQREHLKSRLASDLEAANIRPLSLNIAESGLPHPGISTPYAVSSLPSDDRETMDASLLMSPDYIQPLVPTDLPALIAHVFHPSAISYLRHHASLKLVRHRKSAHSSISSIPRSLPAPIQPSNILSPPLGAANTFALARIADHSQREERLAHIRLSTWAADLQRSIANERARFEALARGERAVWLTQRLGECVADGTLVAVSRPGRGRAGKSEGRRRVMHRVGRGREDPLGLLGVHDRVGEAVWVVVRVVSGVGVVGAIAFWALRGWRGEEGWGVGWEGLIDW